MPALTDGEVVAAIVAGDDELLTAFYEELRSRLTAFAWQRGMAGADSDDCVQDTLAAVVTQVRAGAFRGESTLRTWAHAIFVRRVQDFLRRSARQTRVVASLEVLSRDEAMTDARTPSYWPDHDTRLTVRQALLALPYRERLVLLMNKQDGLTAREIAQLLHMKPKTTEAILTAAKKRFVNLVRESQEMSPIARPRLRGRT